MTEKLRISLSLSAEWKRRAMAALAQNAQHARGLPSLSSIMIRQVLVHLELMNSGEEFHMQPHNGMRLIIPSIRGPLRSGVLMPIGLELSGSHLQVLVVDIHATSV